MRTILILIKKEFLQVFRNPLLLSILVVAPMVEFMIFPFCADYEIKVLNIAFIDNDRSQISKDIIHSFNSSNIFVSKGLLTSKKEADEKMKHDKIDLLVEFPSHFEEALYKNESTQIAVTANAINSVKAGIGTGYVQEIIGGYMQDFAASHTPTGMSTAMMQQEMMKEMSKARASDDRRPSIVMPTTSVVPQTPVRINISNIYWYNEQMNYKNLIVPGILVILVTLIGCYVTALNLVREKEIGTIEQVNVTPIRRWQFLLGKMIPFWLLGMAEFGAGLIIMKFVFGISVQGSLPLLLGITAIYLFVMLGLGFFISSVSENQLQSMFIVLFLFIVFVLLSGVFTPTEGMPEWAHKINYVNPMSFYIEVIKKVILKGSEFESVMRETIVLSVMAVIINTGAVLSYREASK
ncbi:MAG: ABC transporter permease [Bacteroidales bacterium]|nr:ABC transporter permease [Bacteroidales bacterium]